MDETKKATGPTTHAEDAPADSLGTARTLAHPKDLGSADTLAAPSENQSAPAPLEATGQETRRYQIEGEIARGGLGKILRAHDKRLDRPVAIKQLLRARADQTRFLYEALTTAKLQHPAIVPVYEASVWEDGEPYFAMKFVSGRPFDEVIAEAKTLDERLILLPRVIDICEAMAYAHSRRIIHRDLKPQNVLIGEFGETVVIDWGLAKELGDLTPSSRSEDTPLLKRPSDRTASVDRSPASVEAGEGLGVRSPALTQAGAVVGTPMYMPPEQAKGERVDERADVYSLGAILYHLLAGGPPYQGRSSIEILKTLSSAPPLPLRLRQPETPKDLTTIVEKAMAREASDRYPSAKELADELRRFQNGQLVQSHNYTFWQRVKRRAARNKALTAVGLLALLATIGFFFEGARFYQTHQKLVVSEKKLEQENKENLALMGEKAKLAEHFRQQMIEQTVYLAKERLTHDPQESLKTLLRAWEKEMQPLTLAQWAEVRYLAAQALSKPLPSQVAQHQGAALAVAFSPDGKTIASSGADGAILLTPVGGGASQKLSSDDSSALSDLAFSPDGQSIFSCSLAGAIRRWSVSTKESALLYQQSLKVLSLSPDQSLIAAGAPEGEIVLLNPQTGQLQRSLAKQASEPTRLIFSPDGAFLAAGYQDGSLLLWELSSGIPQARPKHTKQIAAMAFSPNGETLFSIDLDGALRASGIKTPAGVQLAQINLDEVPRLAVSSDGRWLAVSVHADIWLYRIGAPEREAIFLRGHQDTIHAMDFASRSSLLVSLSEDGTLRLWDPDSQTSTALQGNHQVAWSFDFSSDEKSLVSAGQDGRILFWALTFEATEDPLVKARAISPEGKLVLFQGEEAALFLQGKDQKRARLTLSHLDEMTAIRFSDDSAWLATASLNGSLLLHNTQTKESIALQESGATISALAFSPDARWLAAGDKQNNVELWDLTSRTKKTLFSHQKSVTALAFSPDGRLLASGGYDQRVALFSLSEGRVLQTFTAPSLLVRALAFSPDSKELATGGGDGKIRFYSLETPAAPPVELTAHGTLIFQLLYSPNGDSLLSMDLERNAKLWDFVGVKKQEAKGRNAGDKGATVGFAFSEDNQSVLLLTRRGNITKEFHHLPAQPESLRELIEWHTAAPK